MRSLAVLFVLAFASGCAGSIEGGPVVPLDQLSSTDSDVVDAYVADHDDIAFAAESGCYWTCRLNLGEALHCMCKCYTCIGFEADKNP